MTWFNKYWDIVDDYYWGMQRLGLEPIPEASIKREGDYISIPNSLLNKNGGKLGRRIGTAKSNLEKLRSDEAALNHALNIAFSIAADSVIENLLFKPLGFSDEGPIESVDKDISKRFCEAGLSNLTQYDGFFVSSKSSIGLEIKLGAATSWDQISKYAFLHLTEESRSERKAQLGLLYIVPDSKKEKLVKRYCINGELLAEEIISRAQNLANPKSINARICAAPNAFRDVLNRTKIVAISWSEFVKSIDAEVSQIGCETAGDKTLSNLLNGLATAIREHKGTEAL